MTFASRAALTVVCLELGAVAACSPRPAAAPAPRPPATAAADAPAVPSTAAPPRPARHAHMVCRSSRDGRPIPCGTPDAVMVGIKED